MKRRTILISIALAGSISLLGCGDSGVGEGTGGMGGGFQNPGGTDGGTGGDSGTGGTPGTGGDGGTGGTPGTGGDGGTGGTPGTGGDGGTGGTPGTGGDGGTGGTPGTGGDGGTGDPFAPETVGPLTPTIPPNSNNCDAMCIVLVECGGDVNVGSALYFQQIQVCTGQCVGNVVSEGPVFLDEFQDALAEEGCYGANVPANTPAGCFHLCRTIRDCTELASNRPTAALDSLENTCVNNCADLDDLSIFVPQMTYIKEALEESTPLATMCSALGL